MQLYNDNLKDFVDSLEEEWKAQVPELSTKPISVVARLVRMSYYVERKVGENLSKYGLTRGEFEVLAVLTRNPFTNITPKILQTKILITSGGLSNRIRKLEEKGLLERIPDRGDRRGVILKITDKGRDLTLQAVNSHVEVERQLSACLSSEEQEQIAYLLKKMIMSQQQELNQNSLR